MNTFFHFSPLLFSFVAGFSLFTIFQRKDETQRIFYLQLPIVFYVFVFGLFIILANLGYIKSESNAEIITIGLIRVLAHTMYYYMVSSVVGAIAAIIQKQWLFLIISLIPLFYYGLSAFGGITWVAYISHPVSILIAIVAGIILLVKNKKKTKQSQERYFDKSTQEEQNHFIPE